MAAIRFIRNINLKVDFDGAETMVPFGAGDIFNTIRMEVDEDGYHDIFMPDGSILRGVSGEVFENKLTPITQVEVVQVEPDNQEIEVDEPDVEPALLDGTMLGKEEEPTYDDYYRSPESPTATHE